MAGDIRARIKRRAGTFTDLEATLTGCLENARSLAGIGAGLIELARLALTPRGRAKLL